MGSTPKSRSSAFSAAPRALPFPWPSAVTSSVGLDPDLAEARSHLVGVRGVAVGGEEDGLVDVAQGDEGVASLNGAPGDAPVPYGGLGYQGHAPVRAPERRVDLFALGPQQTQRDGQASLVLDVRLAAGLDELDAGPSGLLVEVLGQGLVGFAG